MLQGDDPASAARAEAALWAMWCQSGIPEVDDLLQDGVQAMERRDLPEAEACFARIIAQAPRFAEGWNKRATVRYLGGQLRRRHRRLPGNPSPQAASLRRALRPGPLSHGAWTVPRGGGPVQADARRAPASRCRAPQPGAGAGGGGPGQRASAGRSPAAGSLDAPVGANDVRGPSPVLDVALEKGCHRPSVPPTAQPSGVRPCLLRWLGSRTVSPRFTASCRSLTRAMVIEPARLRASYAPRATRPARSSSRQSPGSTRPAPACARGARLRRRPRAFRWPDGIACCGHLS